MSPEVRREPGPGSDRERPVAANSPAHAAHTDPRIGDGKNLHTAGVLGPSVAHAGPRPFLHAEAHRDVAGDRAFVHGHEADFHTRRVAAFNVRELHHWQAGLWRDEWHYGRRGWWWDVGGVWYPYAAPVFPYPEEVAPLVAYDTPVEDGPDTLPPDAPGLATASPGVAPDAPPGAAPTVVAAIAPLPATPLGWYRCDQPGGYFPGLDSCATSWTLVQNAPMPGE